MLYDVRLSEIYFSNTVATFLKIVYIYIYIYIHSERLPQVLYC